MRDYLEELLEGSGALLEELRRAERGLSALSGGERQRISIARAMLNGRSRGWSPRRRRGLTAGKGW